MEQIFLPPGTTFDSLPDMRAVISVQPIMFPPGFTTEYAIPFRTLTPEESENDWKNSGPCRPGTCRVQFRHAYKLKLYRTCCFSGHHSSRSVIVQAGEILLLHEVRPSLQTRDRIRCISPQFSDLTIVGWLHPDVLREVPNDIFTVIEQMPEESTDGKATKSA